MNLIKDKWLPVTRKNSKPGEFENIAVWQLLEHYSDNPVTEIIAPRPDFRNALYQLLIGIVQVAALPEDDEIWAELYYTPWESEEFKQKVLTLEHCFEIDSDGPAFMQDFDLKEDYKEETLGNLFINLPANDHFIPTNERADKSEPLQINPYWAAVALYTLQTFAPSGGRGHRVGLRGGGPLTTILLPKKDLSTLWEKLWLNIIDQESIHLLSGDSRKTDLPDIFPWMKPTKISETKGSELFAEECHPFHMYFGMPRRVRLKFESREGVCDLTGLQCENLVTGYITRHSGNNYSGVWTHPLNAYGFDPKKTDEPPYSRKPSGGGTTYRHWLGLNVKAEGALPAVIVEKSRANEFRLELLKKDGAILWAAGYNMNNMKAECWYDSTLPVYPLDPAIADDLSLFVQGLVKTAQEISNNIKSKVKQAWFKSPKDVKGDFSFIDTAFWQNTEPRFYTMVQEIIENFDVSGVKKELVNGWMDILTSQAYGLFDKWALEQQEDGLDMKRVIKARNDLGKAVGKMRNNLKKHTSSLE
ncbi:CRISPR-associated protein CasA/Cse1 [Chitinispirillum alkaliphilum]|nr:CRISPR-associated protein CasA/Cse1 [Chitinispirillum alkaliphilum]